jgi:hypothetical protein
MMLSIRNIAFATLAALVLSAQAAPSLEARTENQCGGTFHSLTPLDPNVSCH